MTIHKFKNITYDLVKMEKALVFQNLKQSKEFSELISKKTNILNPFCPYLTSEYIDNEKRKENALIIALVSGCLHHPSLWKRPRIQTFSNDSQRDNYYNLTNQVLKEWDLMVEKFKKEKVCTQV